ncbi:hypothetical protein [Ellagibacter isourolithinifaciens]|uniref:hypothetical protein n=1 Tax=Ellagibacter isourolithinifaciens TaxID=2137581 RepID=UPI003A90612C
MPTGFELIKQQVETKKLREELPIVGWFHFPLADPVADGFSAETVKRQPLDIGTSSRL